jgi:predicted N-acetyltransferase YhbS
MEIAYHQETPNDYDKVAKVISSAFESISYSDHKEHLLVARLRNSDAFIPELSIVAKTENEIIGHILLTKIKIKNKQSTFDSLALAPVSVKPIFQNKGVGSGLILEAHRKAKALGYHSIVLLGHADYYPRFGYVLASKFEITLPFDAPEENCMVIELVKDGLKEVSGTVEYPEAFYQ